MPGRLLGRSSARPAASRNFAANREVLPSWRSTRSRNSAADGNNSAVSRVTSSPSGTRMTKPSSDHMVSTSRPRSALRTRQQTLDQFAQTAAYYQIQSGRQWRALQDTTADPIIDPRRRPIGWSNWQRFEDYYTEGELIWLDADTLIRERSQGKRSLDDFARAFFGINDGSTVTVTYTFADVVSALNAVEPYDWAAFLRQRLDAIGKAPPLDGLQRGGYKLVYTDTPSDYQRASDGQSKRTNLLYSIGMQLNEKEPPGSVSEVVWDGPAFKAKLTEGMQILAVNGVGYEADVLKDAIRMAKEPGSRIELILKSGDRYMVANIDYHDGLRYPHLERDATVPARLDEILTPR